MIKQRGLDFRYSTSLREFRNRLSAVGTSSEISFALQDNFGEPTRKAWLMGSWTLGKIGGAVYYQQNNRVYRQGETAVANVGTLTLNANGAYAWKSETAQSTNGQWRNATKAEMKSEGGDGIVLIGAKSGYDWIVTKAAERRSRESGFLSPSSGRGRSRSSAHAAGKCKRHFVGATLMKSALLHLAAHPAVRSYIGG